MATSKKEEGEEDTGNTNVYRRNGYTLKIPNRKVNKRRERG